MVLRADRTVRGATAVRPELVDRMNDLVTAGVTPATGSARTSNRSTTTAARRLTSSR
jgi:histidine ammonia-lyase